MKRVIAFVMLAILAFATVSCSEAKEVGSGIDVEELSEKSKALGEIDEKKSGGGFVGEQEKEEADAQRSDADQEDADAAAAKQREEAAVKIRITASGFDPYYVRVFTGGVIAVTNDDSKVRSVVADRGEFDSLDIAPGGTWTYQPDAAGKFNFHDGTRPFVVGTIEVLAR